MFQSGVQKKPELLVLICCTKTLPQQVGLDRGNSESTAQVPQQFEVDAEDGDELDSP